MATTQEKKEQFAQHWIERINASTTSYQKWESRFKVKKLEDYVEGLQTPEGSNAIVINLIYSSLKIRKPSLLFQRPEFKIKPKPWKSDWNPETAIVNAIYKQDTLNTHISDQKIRFAQEIEMAILDSATRFGMIEVGYSANWIINPNAGKPILKSDYADVEKDSDYGKVVTEPDEIPEKEWIFAKRIPAERIRIGGSDSHDIERCSWVGYYEWVRKEDLFANKKFLKNIKDEDFEELSADRSTDYYFDSDHANPEDRHINSQGDHVKTWKIWDLRRKNFFILIQDPQVCIYEAPFKRLPLFGLRFDLRQKGWLPVPVIYNWKGPQDEINESREQLRRFRRRARQLYQARKGSLDPEDIDKFLFAPDGSLIETNIGDAIGPILNSPVDASIIQTLSLASDEFDKIANTGNNQRGVSDRGTATEAANIEARTRVREQSDQAIVAEWLCAIGKEMLNLIMEKFTEPFFIQTHMDEGDIGEELQVVQQNYQIMHAAMLRDNFDFDVDISVTSMSPVSNEQEKMAFFEFMSILETHPILAMSPNVIRKAAYLCNFRDETVIRDLQRQSQLAMVAKIEEGQANLAAQNNAAQQRTANATPPTGEIARQEVIPQV